MRWLTKRRLGRGGNGRHRADGIRVIAKPPAGALDLLAELDALHYPLCAVDRNGKRYTNATIARETDWWWGATILTPTVTARLKDEGLLPLREVDPRTNEVIL